MTVTQFSIICLSPQDWRVDLPTNRQQIMRRVARRGHAVVFVETGYFLGRHISRLLRESPRRSLLRRLVAHEVVEDGVRVCKAFNLLPWGQRFKLANRVNAALMARRVRRLARSLPHPVVLWIYDPCAAGVIGRAGEVFAVYDCVDDYAWNAPAGPRRRIVAAGDARAARSSRLVFATTPTLEKRHRRSNLSTVLVPNVGDYTHFSTASDRRIAAPEIVDVPRPVLGFAGNFLPTKVDFELLDRLARARPDYTLLLVGPSRPGAEEQLARLETLPNVRWVGAKPYGELPRYVAAFDVALIPYLVNGYTESCFPLKLYEYLAAGKPVVASGVPALGGMEPDVVLAEEHDAFIAAVDAALEHRSEDGVSRRMAVAARNTWESRTEKLLELVTGELEDGAKAG